MQTLTDSFFILFVQSLAMALALGMLLGFLMGIAVTKLGGRVGRVEGRLDTLAIWATAWIADKRGELGEQKGIAE